MSYARWSDSDWYVYETTRSDPPDQKTGWFLRHWMLSVNLDVKRGKDYSVDECKSLTAEQIQKDFDCARDLADELLEYVAEFLVDVGDEPFTRERALSKGGLS